MFFADTTVNTNPTAEDIVNITLLTAEAVRNLRIVPRIALLSYSNFGVPKDDAEMAEAARYLHVHHPELIVDGEIQANFAMNQEKLAESFPFSALHKRRVNTLIFPNLSAGNISYKLLQELAGMDAQGPVLLGMRKSVHYLADGVECEGNWTWFDIRLLSTPKSKTHRCDSSFARTFGRKAPHLRGRGMWRGGILRRHQPNNIRSTWGRRIGQDSHPHGGERRRPIVEFGFATEAERSLFLLLLGVNGVGANTARLILSARMPSLRRWRFQREMWMP